MLLGLVIVAYAVYPQEKQPEPDSASIKHELPPRLQARSFNQYPGYNDAKEFPTLNEIRSSIRRAGLVGNNTIFVHGAPGRRDEAEFSLQFVPSGGYIQHCLDERDMERWVEYNKRPWNTLYWQRVIQALAEESWGTIYLLHPSNHPLMASPEAEASNVPLFPEHAFPYIRRNQRIHSIVYVRYNEVSQDVRTAERQMIWVKGQPFPGQQDITEIGE